MSTPINSETRIWSMKKLLIVSVVAVVVFMFLLNSVLTAIQFQEMHNEEIANNGKMIASNTQNQLKFALVAGLSESAKETLTNLLNYPDVTYAAIYTTSGVLFSQAGKIDEGERYGVISNELSNAGLPSVVKENDHFVHLVQAVLKDQSNSDSPFDFKDAAEPEMLGLLYIVLSKAHNREQNENLVVINIATTFATMTILIIMLLFITRYIVHPIRSIVDEMKRVEKGQKDIRVSVSGPLETRHISRALNKMLEVIDAREEQLKAQNKILHEEISKREASEKERTKLELRLQQAQKNEAIGQLTGGIAHDFNNILATIVGFSSLTKQLGERESHRKIVDYQDEVLSAADRARALIKNMLAFSRNKPSNHRSEIDVPVVVEEAVRMLRSTIPSTVNVIKSIPDRRLIAIADDVRIYQIVLNLCINARDALLEQGTIEIKVEVSEPSGKSCEVCGEKIGGQYIVVRVKDNGIGIRPEVMKRIFEPYFTNKDKGSGLGLSIVAEATHEMNGHLTVSTTVGEGSEFSVYIPLYDSTKNEIVGNADHTKKQIMVVDDEATTTNILYQFLSSEGYSITVLNDSQAACNRLKQEPDKYDLVIADEFMPGLKGSEIARELEDYKGRCKFIIYTGNQKNPKEEPSPSGNIVNYVEKPIDFAKLRHSINDLFSNSNEMERV